jgi:hypothetical protein
MPGQVWQPASAGTEFRNPQALVAALIECGFEADPLEIHQVAVPRYGYPGQVRRHGHCAHL